MLAELLLAAAVTFCPDLNGDGVVDSIDVNILAANWQMLSEDGDVNGDGVVDSFDLNIIAAHWQEAASTDWQNPQRQIIPGVFHPGLVGTHPNGVDHAEFYVNDFTTFYVYPLPDGQNRIEVTGQGTGGWTDQYPMIVSNINPDTGKPGLWITLNAADSPNGPYILVGGLVPTFGKIQYPANALFWTFNHWPVPAAAKGEGQSGALLRTAPSNGRRNRK